MTGRHTTFVIIPENGTWVKQVRFSRGLLLLVACLFVTGAVAITFMAHDYYQVKATLPSVGVLERQVTDQRAQIQAFAKKIEGLKSDMMALQELEEKIRVIANVGEPEGEDAVFGIGGSMPEDLDASLSVGEKDTVLLRQMHRQVERLQTASVVQKAAFGELHEYLQQQKSLLASTPTIRPTTGWISSGFGYRKSPFTGLREFHQGIDIATRRDTPVVAPADGTISFIGKKGRLGNTMVINHGHGVQTRYGHLNKCLVTRGTKVKRGEEVALVGNTGRSTAPHLHYEVLLNSLPVNPKKYILD